METVPHERDVTPELGDGGDPSVALAARLDGLEDLFGQLLGIVTDLARRQADLIEGGRAA